MIHDCPFCTSHCDFYGDDYCVTCSNMKCTYKSGTGPSYEAVVEAHNRVSPLPGSPEFGRWWVRNVDGRELLGWEDDPNSRAEKVYGIAERAFKAGKGES